MKSTIVDNFVDGLWIDKYLENSRLNRFWLPHCFSVFAGSFVEKKFYAASFISDPGPQGKFPRGIINYLQTFATFAVLF